MFPERPRAVAGPGPHREVAGFTSSAGLGVRGIVAGRTVVVGRPELLAEQGILLPPVMRDAVTAARATGRTAVVVGWDGVARGVLVVADAVRTTSAAAVADLRRLGLEHHARRPRHARPEAAAERAHARVGARRREAVTCSARTAIASSTPGAAPAGDAKAGDAKGGDAKGGDKKDSGKDDKKK